MDKISVELGDVQKTLFLPLWGRAFESKKEKPLLRDQTALEIIEKVDYDFASIAKNISELSQVAWIMRSIYIDEVIKNFLDKHLKATIVNVGCSMDTTFDRIDNGSLLWYDLDLPDVIESRRKFIKEGERRKFISASFLDEGWLKEIKVVDGVLFIAAGVFYYFEGYCWQTKNKGSKIKDGGSHVFEDTFTLANAGRYEEDRGEFIR